MNRLNIIQFPRNTETPQTKEDVDNIIGDVRLYHIDQSLEFIIPSLVEQLQMLSLPVEKINEKDLIFVHESIRYLLFKLYGYDHPMQKVVDSTIRQDEQLGMVFDSSNVIKKKKKTNIEE